MDMAFFVQELPCFVTLWGGVLSGKLIQPRKKKKHKVDGIGQKTWGFLMACGDFQDSPNFLKKPLHLENVLMQGNETLGD